MSCPGALCKDVEDQVVAVEDPAFEFPFDVADLAGRKFIIENRNIHFMERDVSADLFQFSFAYIGPRIRKFQFLDEFFHRYAAGCIHQECELFQVFLNGKEILLMMGNTYKNGSFMQDGVRSCSLVIA